MCVLCSSGGWTIAKKIVRASTESPTPLPPHSGSIVKALRGLEFLKPLQYKPWKLLCQPIQPQIAPIQSISKFLQLLHGIRHFSLQSRLEHPQLSSEKKSCALNLNRHPPRILNSQDLRTFRLLTVSMPPRSPAAAAWLA